MVWKVSPTGSQISCCCTAGSTTGRTGRVLAVDGNQDYLSAATGGFRDARERGTRWPRGNGGKDHGQEAH